ncbi:MAG: CHAD domain-containing protein [Anaerolineales bacterium]|nr:CHAD domain-containing protein [Anaerolineales bacterium]
MLTTPDPFPYPIFSSQSKIANVCTSVLDALYKKTLHHEPGTRVGEDIEELHDMRVSVRRQRVAVRVFKGFFLDESIQKIQDINDELRNLGRALGRGRDLDILIDKFNLHLFELPADQADDLYGLIAIWKYYRVKAQTEIIDFLDSYSYQNLLQSYSVFLKEPQDTRPEKIETELPAIIEKRLYSVFKHEDAVNSNNVHQLHRLRIAFKRLRYVIEFFESVLGKEYDNLILQLKEIQDHLGDLNDAAFATRYISALLADWNSVSSTIPDVEQEYKAQLKIYLDVRTQEQELLLDTFPERWTAFLDSDFAIKLKAAAAQ